MAEKKLKDVLKDVELRVRITSEQLESLEEEAARKAVSISQVVRWRITPPEEEKKKRK